jgi:DNA modification methylase
MVPQSTLRPYARNARTHSAQQIEQIAASMALTGFLGSILAKADGTIIAGHGRLEAAKLLGLAEVPVIYLDHLSEAEVRAYRIADNRLAEKAGWSNELLRVEFVELSALNLEFDLSVTGFEHPQIDLMIDAEQAPSPAEAETVSEPEGPAVSRLGDIWLLGSHRLMCGSILDPEAVSALLAGATATMAFTDPPYNVPVTGHVCGLGKIQHREFAMASGEMSEAEFTQFLADALASHAAGAADGSILFVCIDWRHLGELLTATRTCGLELLNLCIWNKTNGGMGSLYRSKHELVLVLKKAGAQHINNVQLGRFGRNRTNVWDYAGVNTFGRDRMEDLASHPTVKPIALVADAIRDVSNRGDIVLDGFMGSGTTLLAAERTGRLAYGMEIDPLYADLAVRRWQDLTGEAATLETGDSFDSAADGREGDAGGR